MRGRNMNNDFNNNPFDEKFEFDFYDSITVKDAKRTVSRSSLGLFLMAAVTTAVIFVVQLILLFALGEKGYTALVGNPYFYIPMGTLLMYAIGLPLLWLLIKDLPKRTKRTNQGLSVAELLAAIPVMQFLANLGQNIGLMLDGVITETFGIESTNPVDSLTTDVPVWLMIAITVVIAPIVEEFIFRKLLLDRLSVYGNVFAIVLTSVMFGLFHGNLYQMFYAFTIGLVFGYVTVKGGSWIWGAALHMFMNFLNGALITLLEDHLNNYYVALDAYIAGDAETFTANIDSFMIGGSLAAILGMLSLLGGVILAYSAVKKTIRIQNDPQIAIPRGQTAPIVFANIGFILLLLFTAFEVFIEYVPIF